MSVSQFGSLMEYVHNARALERKMRELGPQPWYLVPWRDCDE
jgi:hypothetical protein